MASLFRQDIICLKGVGEKSKNLLKKLNINTIGDLIKFYPRTYEDWGKVFFIVKAPLDTYCCVKAVLCSPISKSLIQGGLTVYKLKVCDETGVLRITFFNKFIDKSIIEGKSYIFYGKIKETFGAREMIFPQFVAADKKICIRPIYSQVEGLKSGRIENLVRRALSLLPNKIAESTPENIRTEYNLCELHAAIKNIHFPKDQLSLKAARERLIFEEALVLQLGFIQQKCVNKKKNILKLVKDFSSEFLDSLNFLPTNAQIRCVKECIIDMQRPDFSMNRLIQGDVGSGKTAVAAALCYCVAKSNMQAVFMAPTEILAQQHYKSFQKLFKKCEQKFEDKHVNIEILTGSISMKKRREVLCFLEKGLIDILIGTHALLSESVIFKNLGLVITDEQHRFGVLQRANLAAKGNNPHVLVMSATPIPRTLALIIYGDLDISLLDEKPPGRQKVETIFIKTEKKGRMFEFLKKLIDEGKQGYIVCPVIEKSETSLIAAKEYFNKLKKEDFMNYNIALLHGKMKAEEKATVMGSFAKGEISVLVSTTVIEVGLDISNAVFMVIENAERFGFSQLHQLRGRVGRGNAKSYCILISDAQNKKAVKRLEIMTSTDDGFKIADEDLKIRGPGEFLGERQHGLPDLKILKFSEDIEIFKKTQKLAKKIFEQDPDLSRLEHRFLRSQMRRMFERSFRSFI